MNNNFDKNVINKECNSGHGGVWHSMKVEDTIMEGESCVAWVAWLDGNAVYFSHKNRWEDIPNIGMQMLMLYYENAKRAVFKNYDEYVLEEGKESKLGLMIPFEEYEEIIDRGHCVYYDFKNKKFYVKE